MRVLKLYFLRVKRIFTHSHSSPESMAKGVALGIGVGLTPSVGFQMLPAVFLAWLFRGNKVLALIFTYVSNPITLIPIYGVDFFVGSLIWSNLEGAKFSKIKDVVVDFSFQKMTQVGFESLLVIWTGGLVVAIPAGFVSYFVFLKIILFYKKRKAIRLEKNRVKKILALSKLTGVPPDVSNEPHGNKFDRLKKKNSPVAK